MIYSAAGWVGGGCASSSRVLTVEVDLYTRTQPGGWAGAVCGLIDN